MFEAAGSNRELTRLRVQTRDLQDYGAKRKQLAVTWGSAYGAITNEEQRRGVFELPPRYTSGQTLGIIAVDLDYPKIPGNVVNATTYDFPVLYEMVSFEIERSFAGDPAIKQQVIEAAKKLEAEGVRAIIGACGYFAHFQKDVAAAVGVPVFMSSLCQLATIKTWLPCDRKIAVFAADGASIDDEFLSKRQHYYRPDCRGKCRRYGKLCSYPLGEGSS